VRGLNCQCKAHQLLTLSLCPCSVLRCDVNGRVIMKAFLSGMPDVKLGLNEKIEVCWWSDPVWACLTVTVTCAPHWCTLDTQDGGTVCVGVGACLVKPCVWFLGCGRMHSSSWLSVEGRVARICDNHSSWSWLLCVTLGGRQAGRLCKLKD